MSMDIWVGGNEGTDGGWGASWKVYTKLGQMLTPGPAKTFVFLDEREDSINDGYYVVDMQGYPNQPNRWRIVDYPASYHNNAGGMSFADGHSEIRKWHDGRTTPTISSTDRPLDQSSPNNQDVFFLQDHSTRQAGDSMTP